MSLTKPISRGPVRSRWECASPKPVHTLLLPITYVVHSTPLTLSHNRTPGMEFPSYFAFTFLQPWITLTVAVDSVHRWLCTYSLCIIALGPPLFNILSHVPCLADCWADLKSNFFFLRGEGGGGWRGGDGERVEWRLVDVCAACLWWCFRVCVWNLRVNVLLMWFKIYKKLSKAVNSQCNHIHYRCCVGYGVTCVGQKFILTVNNMMKHTCKNTHCLTLSANVAMHAEMYLKHYP